ncbi:MAG TPA: adenylate kinase [Solibacterales bacterium]|nr:adenylate kinase [Bryobacterales bacterium]
MVASIFILLGPPGSGKGTQADLLTKRLGIPALSTGAMLRAEMAAGTEIGKTAAAISFAGGLVGDEIVNEMVAGRIARPDCAGGFMLDGYPRTVAQAKFLDGLLAQRNLPTPKIVHIDVPDHTVIERICLRRQCPSCGHIYNLKFQPPEVTERCDSDGCALVTRQDDCEETVVNRLASYNKSTAPLLAYYGGPRMVKVDGSQSPAEIHSELLERLDLPSGPVLISVGS